MQYRILVIGLAVMISLALQAAQVDAFVSPWDPTDPRVQAPPVRPTPPPYVEPASHRNPTGHPRSEDASQAEQVEPVQALVEGIVRQVWVVKP